MAIDYDAIARAGGIPKVRPRALVRDARTRAEAAEWRRVCALVDKRDHHFCQVSGVLLSPNHPNPKRALSRHHLEYRSASKGRRYTVTNVWTLSREAHDLAHASALRILDKDGNDALDVRQIAKVAWNREMVPRGSEPFRIRFRRMGAV